MGTNFSSLQGRIPTWLARKATAIFQALPMAARTWAERRGKQLSQSPGGFDQAALSMEIRLKFVRAGMSTQDQQTIINGTLTAVLLAAIAGMPAGHGQPARQIQAFPRLPSAPSIDVETKKLERLVQKRSQLFDLLSKVMERYDASAKSIIQSMRG
jgi:hypothetical protein